MQAPSLARKAISPLTKLYGRGELRYLELLHRFPLRRIRNEKELDSAIAVIDSLIDQKKLSRAEDDYLDVLSDLVEAYETAHYPEPDVPAYRMLAYMMELKEVTQSQVAVGSGISPSTISELLSGKREMNKNQIVKLAAFFKVDPGLFLPDHSAARAVR